MSPLRQLQVALVKGPLGLFRMSARAWGQAALYALSAALLLGGLLALFAFTQDRLGDSLLDFVVPEEGQTVARIFVRFFLASQTNHITINALVTFSLLLVSLSFFHFKERLSRAVETGAGLGKPEDWNPPTFWREARSEVSLVLVYVALFFVVLSVGHSPYPWRRTLATVLSYGIMFGTWAVDFATPILMRRGYGYLQSVKAMARRPLLALAFGAAMSLPLVGLTHAFGRLDGPAVPSIAALFGANIVLILWAAVAGTHVGAAVVEVAARTKPARLPTRLILSGAVVAVLAVGGWMGGHLAVVLAEKSQILKCRYAPDWASIKVTKPALSRLLTGRVGVGVELDIDITNPNTLAVALEKNRLVLSDGTRDLAEGHLSPMRIPAGEMRRQHLALQMDVEVTSLLASIAHWDLGDLRITLFIEIAEGLEYPIYLRGAR